MSRVLSARVDEHTVRLLDDLARRTGDTKRALLERAILELAEQLDREECGDVFARTCGAWQRAESPAETAARARAAFDGSLRRYE